MALHLKLQILVTTIGGYHGRYINSHYKQPRWPYKYPFKATEKRIIAKEAKTSRSKRMNKSLACRNISIQFNEDSL